MDIMPNQEITLSLSANEATVSSLQTNVKWTWSRAIGILMLSGALPLLILLAALVRATSSGKAVYRQKRVGLNGKQFWIYKIRTMYQDAEACGTPKWAVHKDCRITPLGRVLRTLHLDELPQLYNIACGEMSLVGPRPERPEFVAELAKSIPQYLDRLAVLPGVTGLAQVNLNPDDSLESVRKKVILDKEYIRTANVGLDIRLILCTAGQMFHVGHKALRRLFGVDRNVDVLASLLTQDGDSGELAQALDDTALNIPALISKRLEESSNESAKKSHRQREFAAVGVASQRERHNQSEIGASSPIPRKPK